MTIARTLAQSILEDAKGFKVIALLGPRQSGKTTLARQLFPTYSYALLENPDTLRRATNDPRGFLDELSAGPGAIIDEFQNAPELLSYLQGIVDNEYRPGFFILTGSQNFLMNEKISQSLAGRVSIHTLLPLSIQELKASNLLDTCSRTMFNGFYPPIYTQHVTHERWYSSYMQTYLERDVRNLKLVADLSLFQLFVQLCAGRIGQLMNYSSLANDCGIAVNTVKAWLALLEASYIIFMLRPHNKNFNKRLTNAPKLYFYDTGLACALLKITAEALSTHSMRGNLFENMVIADLHKTFFNKGSRPSIYFWRDHTGHEVDGIIELGTHLIPLEIKAGLTVNSDFFNGLTYWNTLANADQAKGYVVYGGEEKQLRKQGTLLPWHTADSMLKP